MNWIKICSPLFLVVACFTLLSGCGVTSKSVSADLSYTNSDISAISFSPDIKVVGLGEASHGVSEYQEMKSDIFKALVQSNGCQTFIIEGDFGGALKVDTYINGGSGSAEEVVKEIGFSIYHTQEMVDLIEWMRFYNETALPENKLHFYGMDVQRFDNSKEYLFSTLNQSVPELSAKYLEVLAQFTDENISLLSKDDFINGKNTISKLIEEMDSVESDIVSLVGQTTFDFARECANTIYACCDVQSNDNYNATRDKYMFNKVKWFLQYGNESVLFINGHNGHIGETSVAGYTCLGELLSDDLGNSYYSIGTDAQITRFNSQKENNEFEIVEVSNQNDLNSQFEHSDTNQYFIDFDLASSDDIWKQIANSSQKVTTLNVSLTEWQKLISSAYTTTIIPESTYDSMIIFYSVSPTTLLQ